MMVEDQQWLERAVDRYHSRLLETPAAQDYLRSRGITATEFAASFCVGYADGTLAQKLPAEGRRALRRVGVLTGSGRELLRGCVLFPLVAAEGANSGHVVGLYGRSIEGRRHLYLPGERRGVFNPQGAKNTDEVIITESAIDAAALWSAGLRNVIPVITENAESSAADASAARAVRAEASEATALAGALMQLETSNDGAMLFGSDGRAYRVRGLSPVFQVRNVLRTYEVGLRVKNR